MIKERKEKKKNNRNEQKIFFVDSCFVLAIFKPYLEDVWLIDWLFVCAMSQFIFLRGLHNRLLPLDEGNINPKTKSPTSYFGAIDPSMSPNRSSRV